MSYQSVGRILVFCWMGFACVEKSSYVNFDIEGSRYIYSTVNLETGQDIVATFQFRTSSGEVIDNAGFSVVDPTCRMDQDIAKADNLGIATMRLSQCDVGQHRLTTYLHVNTYKIELEQSRFINVLPPFQESVDEGVLSKPVDTLLNVDVILPDGQMSDVKAMVQEELFIRSSDVLATLPYVAPFSATPEHFAQVIYQRGLMFRTLGEHNVQIYDKQGRLWTEHQFDIKEHPHDRNATPLFQVPQVVIAGVPFDANVILPGPFSKRALFATERLFWLAGQPNALLPQEATEHTEEQGSMVKHVKGLILYQSGVTTLTVQSQSLPAIRQSIVVLPNQMSSLELQTAPQAVVGQPEQVVFMAYDAYRNVVDTVGEMDVQLSTTDPVMVLPPTLRLIYGMGVLNVSWRTTGMQSLSGQWGPSDLAVASVQVSGVGTQLIAQAPLQVAAGQAFSIPISAVDVNQWLASSVQTYCNVQTSDQQAVAPIFIQLQQGQANLGGGQPLILKTLGQQHIRIDDVTGQLPPLVISISVTANTTHGFLLTPLTHPVPIRQATPFRVQPIDLFGNPTIGFAGEVVFSSLDSNVRFDDGQGGFVATFSHTWNGTEQEGVVIRPGVLSQSSAPFVVLAQAVLAGWTGESQPIEVRRPTMLAGTQDGESMCIRFDDGAMKCWGMSNAPQYLGVEGGILGYGDAINRGAEPNQMGMYLPVIDLGVDRKVKHIPGANRLMNCAVLEDGDVKCWGGNGLGQLGLGDIMARGISPLHMGDALPTVRLGSNVKAEFITVGGRSTRHAWACVITESGDTKCWGSNWFGELGLNDTQYRGSNPSHMGDNLPFLQFGVGRKVTGIKAGGVSTCALLDNQTIKCFGANNYYDEWWNHAPGVLGTGDTLNRGDGTTGSLQQQPPVDLGPTTSVDQVSMGTYRVCALINHRSQVKCWGVNWFGSLGVGDEQNRGTHPSHMGANLPPVQLGTLDSIQQLIMGTYHSCVLSQSGVLKCWGYNGDGQLGLGDNISRGRSNGEMGAALPAVDLGPEPIVHLATSGYFNCALLANGRGKCWGGTGNMLGLGRNDGAKGDGPNEMGTYLPYLEW